MAMQWVSEVNKPAILDEADQLAVRHLQDEFKDVREAYKTVEFDIAEKCRMLALLVADGRDALAQQEAAQNRYELESEERRAVVDEITVWFDKLHRAGRYAKATHHPLGKRLPKVFFTGETDLNSWRDGLVSLNRVIANLAALPVEWKTVGLPADFVDSGKALVLMMTTERNEAIAAESQRRLHTERLTWVIDEIVDHLEQINAARDLAMVMTGRELPGLELSLVKSAAAPRGPSAPPPAAPTTPETGL